MAEQKKHTGKPTNIGEFVVWFRGKRNWSQRDLGNVVEFSPIYLSQVENGQYQVPLEFVRRLFALIDNDQERKVLREIILSIYEEAPSLGVVQEPEPKPKKKKRPVKAPLPMPLSKLVKKRPVRN